MPYRYRLDFEALLKALESASIKVSRWWNPLIIEFETEERIPEPPTTQKKLYFIYHLLKEEEIP